jgi:transformer-2 protein
LTELLILSRRKDRDRKDRRRRDRTPSEEVKNDGTTVYIKNLSRKIKKRELEDLLADFGEINDVDIVRDPFTE